MGLLQRFERRLEGMVGGTFARLFKGQVEPVEIAKALQREAEENRAVVGGGRVLVPNRYLVELGTSDYTRLEQWERQLTRTLAEMVQEFLDEEGWSTYGDIEVSFDLDKSLRTGMFRVGSDVDMDAPPRQRPRDSLSQPLPPGAAGYSAPPMPPAPPVMPAPTPLPAYQPEPAPTYQPEPAPAYQAENSYGETRVAPPYQQDALYDARPEPVLVVEGTERRYPIRPGSTLIGRGQDADVRLADTGVSRRHAVVRFDGNAAVVEDLNSTNGTVVNGQRIRTWRLQSEDAIRVGHTVVVFRQES
ncbi:MAG TPA: FhaA domain-containing protein [Mycobacteriales bacterium]|nr:FhaA domain-containing protein [Mycobacteriales bacterium]